MVLAERRVPPNVNPTLPSPPPGWTWERIRRDGTKVVIGWPGTAEEAEQYMVVVDSQRLYSQIVNRQREAREAREGGRGN